MDSHILNELALILILGITAQWLAWRIRVPSIVLLLTFGFLAGPISGLISPITILGDKLFFSVISLLVSIIIFEGGMSLRLQDLKGVATTVSKLIIFGTLLSFICIALSTYFILGLDFQMAMIFSAMMVITGPTVIVPMLRHVSLDKKFGSIMRWEGILIAPVGLLLIVVVKQLLFSEGYAAINILMKTFIMGSFFGIITAMILLWIIRKKWAPDFLEEVLTLMMVIGCYTQANFLIQDSGLIAVVVMGIILTNQKTVAIQHIATFKENLRILAISTLFILLASSIDLYKIVHLLKQLGGWNIFFYLIALFFFARPIPVLLSTIGSALSWKEKIFLSWMAPRGIVTASIASLFALELIDARVPNAENLVPLTFLVIIVTVGVYGFTATPLQRLLKLSQDNKSVIMIVGASIFSRKLAKILEPFNITCVLIDTNRSAINIAKRENISAHTYSAFSNKILEEVEMGGVGKMLAITSNNKVNALVYLNYTDVLGKDNLFYLNNPKQEHSQPLGGQDHQLFHTQASTHFLDTLLDQGVTMVTQEITTEEDIEEHTKNVFKNRLPLVKIDKEKKLHFATAHETLTIKTGETLIYLPLKNPLPAMA